ncbi:unnamed protein product [Rangifer tarandus platyrhynchus]|uniref:Uncharacterized protein n=1 Tax=Rangifer tarandus platyrhynchus TaxID=3082113 RepID=A0ABN8YYZ4_RANTA|nr:unnamed protein product [Rangifer tarandus platyrhynchus]
MLLSFGELALCRCPESQQYTPLSSPKGQEPAGAGSSDLHLHTHLQDVFLLLVSAPWWVRLVERLVHASCREVPASAPWWVRLVERLVQGSCREGLVSAPC